MSTSTPVISGATGSVYEDSIWPVGSNNLTAFNGITVTGDQGQSSFVTFAAQSSTPGTYGTFTLATNGIWTYTADNTQTAIQQLGSGQSLTDSFTAVSADGTLSVPVTVTIAGTNDAPVIGGVSTGQVTEDVNVINGNLTTGGTLTITDVDQGQSQFTAQTRNTAYGTFTLAADGSWTYAADDSQRSIQQLGAGQSITDSFFAVSSDGSAGQLVTVTINGTHDDPVVSGSVTGSVYEDSIWPAGSHTLTTFGAITVTGDQGQSRFSAQSSTPGTYGTFTLATNGIWTYTADNTQTAIQQLGSGQSLTDSFTAVSADGTLSVPVTVTIAGTNDAPVIGGVSTGQVTEDVNVINGNLTTGGTLTISDADQGQSSFAAQTRNAFYGTFTLTADGTWTYTADNSQLSIQQLGAGESVTDSFFARSSDGSAGQLVTVTINGTHDNPVVSGGLTGDVYEDQVWPSGTNSLHTFNGISVTGDQGESHFVDQSGTAGTYGAFTLGWNGVWTYTADNSQTAIQQLAAGQSLTDTFTAVSLDGTLRLPINVTIHGVNDVPVIGGTSTGSVTEDVNVSNGNLTAGGMLTISDADQGQSSFQAQANTHATYGTFSLAANGAWTYAVDNSWTPLLAAGATATDSFTASSSDHTATQVVTVTINAPPSTLAPQAYHLQFASGDHIDLTLSSSLRIEQGIWPPSPGYAVLSGSGVIGGDQVRLFGGSGSAVDPITRNLFDNVIFPVGPGYNRSNGYGIDNLGLDFVGQSGTHYNLFHLGPDLASGAFFISSSANPAATMPTLQSASISHRVNNADGTYDIVSSNVYGQSYTAFDNHFDPGGNLLSQSFGNADGTHDNANYDTAGLPYSAAISHFDASWHLLSQTLNNRDGTHDVTAYDGQGHASVQDHYGANWHLLWETTNNSDGTHDRAAYELQGQSYTSYRNHFDFDWNLQYQTIDNKDGSHDYAAYNITGQSYTSLDNHYDSSWHLLWQSFSNADGTHDYANYDTQGQPYSGAISHFDASWHLLSQTLNNRDGTHDVTAYDGQGRASVQDHYGANWHLLWETTNNSDGTHDRAAYELQDQSYTSYHNHFDSNWNLQYQTIDNNDGSHDYAAYNITAQSYTSLDNHYDSSWHLLGQSFSNPDGTHDYANYDTQGLPYSAAISHFDASWHLLSQTLNNRDGTHDMIDYNAQGQRSSDSHYDANWNLVAQTFAT